MTIEELKKEESELREKLSANLQAQMNIATDAFTSEYGVAVGDKIAFMDGRETLEGVVFKIKGSEPYVYLMKKDGTVGIREKKLYSWHLKSIKLVEKAK